MRYKDFASARNVLGFGAANVGNLYREVSDEDAWAVMEAAWDAGIRYYDTAPHYGQGFSERRLGEFLRSKPRDEFVLSTKAGRLLVPNDDYHGQLDMEGDAEFAVPMLLKRQWDFSASGIRQSIEESLQRLELDRIDLVYLHDPERYDQDRGLGSGMPALAGLREEGLISGIGVGSMTTETLAAAIDLEPDMLMVAGRYTLLEQPAAGVLDRCAERDVGVVLASIYNSGILAREELPADARYDYGPVPEWIRERHTSLVQLCRAHGVPLQAAVLQLGGQHPAVRATVIGTGKSAQVKQAVEWMRVPIPAALWDELRGLNLY